MSQAARPKVIPIPKPDYRVDVTVYGGRDKLMQFEGIKAFNIENGFMKFETSEGRLIITNFPSFLEEVPMRPPAPTAPPERPAKP